MKAMKPQRMLTLFSKNVLRLRQEAGMTQEALAKRCTKYKRQIPKIENGTAEVNLSMIFTLAQALEVDPATLLKESPVSGYHNR
ncbi:XRE family transcriptional regulator [Rhodoferax lacus]|uniref:XRE family transcriptional regulator n=1 Tax=Rhodoferax lacus TaxID=2184758 RepID=A0A3E1RGF0_9BURK|nr:helix-turn-helix transcriptional regulator [Rhodoferax lacus]RFO97680.1 XRE family transcriptional regulator [Rhodoferax lacus]